MRALKYMGHNPRSFAIFSVILYFVLVFGVTLSYQTNFLKEGDGLAYSAVAEDIFHLNLPRTRALLDENKAPPSASDPPPSVPLNDRLRESQPLSFAMKVLKDLNAGFLPGYLVGSALPAMDNFLNYYIGQAICYVVFLTLAYSALARVSEFDREKLRVGYLFSLFAPYMVVIGAFPTKYLMVYVALFLVMNLFYLCYCSLKLRNIVLLFLSLLLLLVVKFQMAIVLGAVTILVLWIRSRKWIYGLALVPCLFLVNSNVSYFYNLYIQQSEDGQGRKFEALYNNYLIRLLIKYAMDMYGAFPWHGGIDSIVALGGALAPLVMLFQLANFAFNSAFQKRGPEPKYDQFVGWVAAAMSLTVFFGKTGFLEYLAIYFPFIGIKLEKRKIILPLILSFAIYFSVILVKVFWRG
ncbi:MAG TPA: hypothetical protein VN112_03715 [Ensifer sp.]|nr:hypothetical protein [Ensifer sp.]